MSACRSVAFFPCHGKSLPRRSLGGECPLFGLFFQVPPSALPFVVLRLGSFSLTTTRFSPHSKSFSQRHVDCPNIIGRHQCATSNSLTPCFAIRPRSSASGLAAAAFSALPAGSTPVVPSAMEGAAPTISSIPSRLCVNARGFDSSPSVLAFTAVPGCQQALARSNFSQLSQSGFSSLQHTGVHASLPVPATARSTLLIVFYASTGVQVAIHPCPCHWLW
jgi:hypothetical protein